MVICIPVAFCNMRPLTSLTSQKVADGRGRDHPAMGRGRGRDQLELELVNKGSGTTRNIIVG